MKKSFKLLSGLICSLILFSVCGCGNTAKNNSVEKKTVRSTVSTSTTQAVTTAEKKEAQKPINILTGEIYNGKNAVGKRPVAIMVNNIDASMPQYGTYAADMLIECPVEGGITRLMALYNDYTAVPKVCSVRSCRYYFALLAQSFDAIYLHWGIDKKIAAPMLSDLKIDHIDGNSNSVLFKRDPDRLYSYSLEHTGYCDGKLIPSEIKKAGIRTDLKKGYNQAVFNFNAKPVAVSNVNAQKVSVKFSNSYYSTFNYNSKTKTYLKNRNGNKHIDVSNNKQLEFSNIVVLESNSINIVNNNNGLLKIDWKGGTGYCFSGGAVRKIYWSKDSEFGKLELTDSKGNPIKLNKGKTYIGVTEKNKTSYK